MCQDDGVVTEVHAVRVDIAGHDIVGVSLSSHRLQCGDLQLRTHAAQDAISGEGGLERVVEELQVIRLAV
jgi:hypothetical protein